MLIVAWIFASGDLVLRVRNLQTIVALRGFVFDLGSGARRILVGRWEYGL